VPMVRRASAPRGALLAIVPTACTIPVNISSISR
jgi:hypothetical protein